MIMYNVKRVTDSGKPKSAALLTFLAYFSSLFSFQVRKHCSLLHHCQPGFQQQQAAVFKEKDTHCTLPAQYHTADRHIVLFCVVLP